MRNIKEGAKKHRFSICLMLILFIIYLCFHITEQLREIDIAEECDLFDTETLPESELDTLLAERGIDASVIECIPVWEKQYLLDCDVDAASFGENANYAWEHSNGYKKLSDENFSMQIIVARIWSGEGEKCYPLYHVIVAYEWRELPVWTIEDDLAIVWDDEVYLSTGDYKRVDYTYKGSKVVKAVTEESLSSAASCVVSWGIDIKRSLGGSVKGGYVTVTLCKKNYFKENEEEPFEIQVCYTHNIATLKSGIQLVGKQIRLRQSIWARHYLLKNRYNFTDL